MDSNRVKPDYHFIRIVFFCSFLFLSARFLCSLAGYAQKHVSTCWTLWAKASLRFEEHILNLFNSRYYSFMKTNITIIKAYQNT